MNMTSQDLPLLIEDLTQNYKIKALKFYSHFYLRRSSGDFSWLKTRKRPIPSR